MMMQGRGGRVIVFSMLLLLILRVTMATRCITTLFSLFKRHRSPLFSMGAGADAGIYIFCLYTAAVLQSNASKYENFMVKTWTDILA